ncbi:hypothetical protein QBC39DRAFT_370824 [Podospora conica]|nr:hypothetical protein QBC39DRAFT_370824 [Schizothecium conicum]
MPPKIVSIIGATGPQGKDVVPAFITNPLYHPPSPSPAAQSASLATADLDSLPSLTAALANSSIIFGVTNFFEPFTLLSDPTLAMVIETHQGRWWKGGRG